MAVRGDEAALFDVLTKWALDASANGTGGDDAALRAHLAGRLPLATRPSYREDVDRLRAYSRSALQRLARFRELTTPEGLVRIRRPVAGAVVDAARGGSFLITGEPGAGKSAVLHEAAEVLAADAPVVVLTVETTATSLDGLRREIGLEHPVSDVLRALPGDRPAYLIIDALDAARGGLAEAVYRRLLEDVAQLDGWRVVASVRSFDLRMGRELRSVFAGTPPDPAFSEVAFRGTAHLHVSVLSEAELEEAGGQSAALNSALEVGGPHLRDLVRNAFNLALLGELLAAGTDPDALARVASRGQLLERYWEERVSDAGAAGLVTLAGLVESMLSSRSTTTVITSMNPNLAAGLDELGPATLPIAAGASRLSTSGRSART